MFPTIAMAFGRPAIPDASLPQLAEAVRRAQANPPLEGVDRAIFATLSTLTDPVNRALAEHLHHSQSPTFVQWEIAHALYREDAQRFAQVAPIVLWPLAKKRFSTLDLVAAMGASISPGPINVIAHADHQPRAQAILKRAGYLPHALGSTYLYDPESVQPYTATRPRYLAYDAGARVYCALAQMTARHP